jgi:hypothetical protein
MRNTQSSSSIRARLLTLLVAPSVLLSVQACTDLTETPASAITPENFYRNEAEVRAALASVYAQMRFALRDDGDYWAVSEVSSDEMVVPTRGTDWLDGGRWIELDGHAWAPASAAGGDDLNGAWVAAFTGITRANVVLEALAKVDVLNEQVVEAELRTLRAFYYYQLMDMFGGVPIVTTTEIAARARATRPETFKFIEDELNAVRQTLPVSWDAANYGRMTRGAADAILASMYLNAGVFNKNAGVSPTAYNSCRGVTVSNNQDACAAAVAAADRILNSPAYALATNWRSNFTADNESSPENILVARHTNADGLGMTFLMRALHYTQLNPSPWNGFSTLAEVYNAFDPDDQRRQIFLVGQQVNLDPQSPNFNQTVEDRQGNPLVFTPEIGDIRNANEREGVRIAKWPPDPDHVGPEHGNDFAFFRLSEIYLIKAEALNEITPGSGAALDLVNTLRARVFNPPEPLATINRDAILRERLFEFTGEGKRRQDLIRHGQFTRAWQFKGASAAHRILMPIPQQQMDANQELCQNTGYGGNECT